MNGTEVYGALQANGVTHLHHANTVATSCTFLQNKGLLSRGWIEYYNLPQTPQSSDAIDKKYGIWNDVFMDGVDIHARASTRNFYGPVLFEFPLDMLLSLPAGTDVMVTKKNPANWHDGEQSTEWYYGNPAELQADYSFGDFGKHIVFRNAMWMLPFDKLPVSIILDNPQASLSSGVDAYGAAEAKLQAAANTGGISITIRARQCSYGCKCLSSSRGYSGLYLDAIF